MMGRRREEGGDAECLAVGGGELSQLKDSDLRRSRRVRGGNVIARRGCGSLEAGVLLLVGRT